MKKSRLLVLVLVIVALIGTMATCSARRTSRARQSEPQSTSTVQAGKPLSVVATTTQLTDFVRVIGGQRVQVYSVLKPGGRPHGYELSPDDITAIANADVVIANGAGLDDWLLNRWSSIDHKGVLINASSGIRLRKNSPLGEGPSDPHIWMSLANAQFMTSNVRKGLADVEKSSGTFFESNERAYSAQLQMLQNDASLALRAYRDRPIIVSHDALGYLADAYNLRVIGSAISGFDLTTAPIDKATKDAEFAKLVADAKQNNVRALINVDNVGMSELSEVGKQIGVTIASSAPGAKDSGTKDVAYADSLGDANSGAATYLLAMRQNIDVLTRSLQGS